MAGYRELIERELKARISAPGGEGAPGEASENDGPGGGSG